MKTYLHLKSGNRYPEHGCGCWFAKSSYNKGKLQHHIKPGYPQCTNGWKTVKLKEWQIEEIPDLAKPFTHDQFKDYVRQYGVICAQEFLECCDYSKPTFAQQILNPPTGNWSLETREWFESIFESSIDTFICGYSMMLCNHYAIDILKFERHLFNWFNYPRDKDGSMRDFIAQRFGQPNADRFAALLAPLQTVTPPTPNP